MRLFPFVRYWLFVCGFFVALLALLHRASILAFVLTLVCVTPAYLLFERGQIWLGVVVFFYGDGTERNAQFGDGVLVGFLRGQVYSSDIIGNTNVGGCASVAR
jgi:hypothetical protein